MANNILTLKDDRNAVAANLLGVLLAENGKAADGIRALSLVCKDHHASGFNACMLEFIKKKFKKSLTMLEGAKSPKEWKGEDLYSILLAMNHDYPRAERSFKYAHLKSPTLPTLYNIASVLNEKIKRAFRKRHEKLTTLKRRSVELRCAERLFQKVLWRLKRKQLTEVDSELNRAQLQKKRFAAIKKRAENQLFYLKENKKRYDDIIEDEGKRVEAGKKSVLERKVLIDAEQKKEDEKRAKEEALAQSKLELREKKLRDSRKLQEMMEMDIISSLKKGNKKSKDSKKTKHSSGSEDKEYERAKTRVRKRHQMEAKQNIKGAERGRKVRFVILYFVFQGACIYWGF